MRAEQAEQDEVGAARLREHPLLGAAEAGEVVSFTLDGRELRGYAGEPLAAALLAHGVMRARTMPGDGAPRGLFCGVGRCSDCLMLVNGEPNVRACVTPLAAGMRVETQQGLGAWEAGS
jgi:aerobic-type carbon monoxide dehydrogenase small subunit (CoxS/CutS family)